MRGRAERSAHAAEVERWRAALSAARAEIERYRERDSFDALAAGMASPNPADVTRSERPAVAAPVPAAAAPAAAMGVSGGGSSDGLEPGNGLLDRIVLTRHWGYFMEGGSMPPHPAGRTGKASQAAGQPGGGHAPVAMHGVMHAHAPMHAPTLAFRQSQTTSQQPVGRLADGAWRR